MLYRQRSVKCSIYCLVIILMHFAGIRIALADHPGEVFFIDAADIKPKVLQDTIGVLSLSFAIDYQRGTPEISHLPTYTRHAERFASDGTLVVADCVAISGVPWDSFRVLRFPIVEVQGDYRKIVYDSLWDWRVWINIVEISAVFASDDEYSANRIESELYFTDPIVPVPIDIFSLSLNENRKLYHSPDESADFSIISPASKTLRNIENQGRDYLYALYFHQIRNGFAELWLDHGKDFEPEQLGWIKIVDESYHCFAHYFPEKRAGFLANIFFLADAQETRKLYQAPDDQASFRLLVPDGAPVSRRMHVARIHNGFALLAEFDYCFTDTLRPLGWIKIRDKDHRLLIWPVAPWLCT